MRRLCLLLLLPVAACTGSDPVSSPASTPSGSDAGTNPIDGTPTDTAIALEPLTGGRVFLVQGQTTKVPIKVRRGLTANKPITISLAALPQGLPPGVVQEPLVIAEGVTDGELAIVVASDAAQGPLDATLTATMNLDGSAAKTETAQIPFACFVRGAPGAVDTTFGKSGVATELFKDEAWPADIVVLPTDDIVVVSELRSDVARAAAVHLSADGAPDAAYGTQGVAKLGFNYPLTAVAQSDGKVVIGGGITSSAAVGRLTQAGAPDATFGDGAYGPGTRGIVPASGVAGAIHSMFVRPDGDIALTFDWSNGLAILGTARLNGTGGLGTYGIGASTFGDTDAIGVGIAVRPTGQVVTVAAYGGGIGIFQANGDTGAPDMTFGAATGRTKFPRADATTNTTGIALLADETVAVPFFDGTTGALHVMRIAKDGKTLVPGFGTGGIAGPFPSTTRSPSDIARQSDGKLLVALAGPGGQEIVRLTATGSLDTSFGQNGRVVTKLATDSYGKAIALQKDGRILVVGRSTKGALYDTTVTRYWQ